VGTARRKGGSGNRGRPVGGEGSGLKEAVTAVVTAAIDSIDPFALRDRFEFNEIYSTSFSDGWIPSRV
jgi:hypothetical protein